MPREDIDVSGEVRRILSDEAIEVLVEAELLQVEAGVELDGRGYIRVNGQLETSAPDVWALGECAGSPQFTHISEDDFRIIRDHLAGGNRSTRDRLVPYCTTNANQANIQPVYEVFANAQDRDLGGISRDINKIVAEYIRHKWRPATL